MSSDVEEIEYQALDPRQPLLHQGPRQPLFQSSIAEPQESEGDGEVQEEHGFMVHMSPDGNKSQWNHVDDLDKFFVSIYDYHQRHGFQNMVLAEVLQLLQFVFVTVFVTFLCWCVNYPELFDEVPHNTTQKKTFSDVTYSFGQCVNRFNVFTWMLLTLCFFFLIGRSIKMMVNFSIYLRTRNFFISALNIETKELSNMTWHEVQARLLEVQKEEQICIHKQELTQLDIYHRILRFKNYLVAMVNKHLLPVKVRIPLVGEYALLTHGIRFNLDFLLYWSPWSIFLNSYTLRAEYRNHRKRAHLARQLSTHITVLAALNLVLCPFIFFYQIIYFFFRYTEFVKRSPSLLGSRQWTNYARLYLRHFNELDHELNARLNRAYIPSKMYMNSFVSPSLTILAKYTAFFAGAPAAVFFILGVMDFTDVTRVEHLFTVASLCGVVATVCSSVIPDENEVHCPERLMMSILAQIHYIPGHWKGRAHSTVVRDEFSMLFQYKVVYILEELFSPLITPFWLFFALRPKSMDIVDFFRCFTVDVAGVGDVCSYAQMDIKKHGNPHWRNTKPSGQTAEKSQQAENGKIELSLMHFTATNPEWKPPQESNNFVSDVIHEVQRDLPKLASIVADPVSLQGYGYPHHMQSMLLPYTPESPPGALHQSPPQLETSFIGARQPAPPKLRGGLSHLDGPLRVSSALTSSLTTSGSFYSANYGMNMVDEGQRELLYGNMSLSVLALHEAHHRQKLQRLNLNNEPSFQPVSDFTTGRYQHNLEIFPSINEKYSLSRKPFSSLDSPVQGQKAKSPSNQGEDAFPGYSDTLTSSSLGDSQYTSQPPEAGATGFQDPLDLYRLPPVRPSNIPPASAAVRPGTASSGYTQPLPESRGHHQEDIIEEHELDTSKS